MSASPTSQGWDAIIIGGGPAGSSCAWKLQQAGLRVLLLDKKAFPRDKPCAGWITPQVAQALAIDLDQYGQQHVLQPITGFRTGLIGRGEVQTNYERIISYGIRRCQFDSYLLDRSGAAVQYEPLESADYRQGQWLINGRFSAPLLIGAGGHFCPVARMLGARRQPTASVVRAQEAEFLLDDNQLAQVHIRPEVPELFFCEDLRGYGWCFRKGSYLNIGLGRTEPEQLSRHVSEFCEFLRVRQKVQCQITGRFVGHAYQLYERVVPTLFADGVLLVGDAAGLAYPQSGEGIRPAVESALLAAEVILSVQGDYGAAELEPYAARVAERFGQPRKNAASGWLPEAFVQALAGRLLQNRWFARHVVMDRWFLHTQQPALQA